MPPKSKNSCDNPNKKVTNSNERSRGTIARLRMYRARIRHDSKGRVIGGEFMSKEASLDGRIAPNRKWFGNTRIIGQKQLEEFRDEYKKKLADPNSFILKQRTLPLSLLEDSKYATAKPKILETESFEAVFSNQTPRKRPKINATSLEELIANASDSHENYNKEDDTNITTDKTHKDYRDAVFDRAQTHRVYGELYKVIDSSDLIIQVLDARDPVGTRSATIEAYLKKPENAHKHMMIVINKCDLVPQWVTARWVSIFSKEYPTLAFHASRTSPFGKGALINLLRQYSTLHTDKKQISVGLAGYPNVGKSSIINALRSKKVCNVAPIPGETKVWQYVTLTNKVYMIDCPGVVYPSKSISNADLVLRGVYRIENLEKPEDYLDELLQRTKPEYIAKTYGVSEWKNSEDLLDILGRKMGRLVKGGDVDMGAVAKVILNDWCRGKLPYFVAPPFEDSSDAVTDIPYDVKQPTQRFGSIIESLDFIEDDQIELIEEFETKADIEGSEQGEEATEAEGAAEEDEQEDQEDEEELSEQDYEREYRKAIGDLDGDDELKKDKKKRLKSSDIELKDFVVEKKQRKKIIGKVRVGRVVTPQRPDARVKLDKHELLVEQPKKAAKKRKAVSLGKQKVGVHFYAEAKKKKEILEKKAGKRFA